MKKKIVVDNLNSMYEELNSKKTFTLDDVFRINWQTKALLSYTIKDTKHINLLLNKIIEILEKVPTTGISLGNNCYKIRIAIASKGEGKSGGARILTNFQLEKKFCLTTYYL